MYETLSHTDVSIFNSTGKLHCRCSYGKKFNLHNCEIKSIGYQAIPVGDVEKFFIVRSPWTKCETHGKRSKLYGYSKEEDKLYLGLFSIYINTANFNDV